MNRKLDRLTIIKIDVEGAELDVLYGSITTLEKFRPIVLFEFARLHARESQITPDLIVDFFEQHKYQIFNLDRLELERHPFIAACDEASNSNYDRNAETNFLAIPTA